MSLTEAETTALDIGTHDVAVWIRNDALDHPIFRRRQFHVIISPGGVPLPI